jgi:hypothetical protein
MPKFLAEGRFFMFKQVVEVCHDGCAADHLRSVMNRRWFTLEVPWDEE